jgi:hypothetical protein
MNTKVEIFDALGRSVKIAQKGETGPGFHAVVVNTDELSNGIYYYTLTAGSHTATKIMSVVR